MWYIKDYYIPLQLSVSFVAVNNCKCGGDEDRFGQEGKMHIEQHFPVSTRLQVSILFYPKFVE